MKEDKDKKKSHAAGYAIFLLVALIVILALLAGVFVTSSVVESSHEHAWDDGVETVAATCEDTGTMTYTCTVCGDKREEAIKPLGHDWESEYTAATCVGVGYVTQVCARCEASQTIPGAQATGVHTMGDEYERDEPTCIETGELRYTCIICGQEIAEELPATGEHVWDGGEVTTEPTCEEAGVMTYTCTLCDEETKTEPITALGHDWQNEYCDATCVSAGYVLQTCSKCGETQTITGAQATGVHIMGDVVERTEPTCVDDGVLKYTCVICSQEITEEISATGEHVWDEGEETTAPTCTEDGETTYTCRVCNEATKTEPIAALGHDLETTHTDATCTTAGSTVVRCKREGCSYTETTPGDNPTGIHKRGDDVAYTTVPDCENAGEITYICEVCNQTITENVPALGHNYEESWEWHATLNSDQNGYDVSAYFADACTRCGEERIARTSVTNITSNTDGTYTGAVEVEGENYSDTRRVFADAISEGGNDDEKEGVVTDVSMGTEYTPVYDDDGNMSYELTSVPTDSDSTYVVIAGYVDGVSVSVGDYITCYVNDQKKIVRNVNYIETLVFEEGISSIGDYSFYYCPALTSVTFCSTLIEIGDHSFYNCTGLTSIDFPDGLEKIGDCAFAKCSSLTSLTFNDGLIAIGESAFSDCTGIAGCIEIPSSVTTIALDAFENCTNSGLTSVVIHGNESGTTIGDNAFQKCSHVATVTFDGGKFDIGKYAFEYCNELTTLIIVNGADFTSVGSEAFRNNASSGTSPVTTVYYDGTGNQWDAIAAVFNASYDNIPSGCKVYYYSETSASNCWHWGDDGAPTLWNA